MQKAKGLILLAVIGLLFVSFTLTSCTGHPNEKQLQAMEETKAAAMAAESSQSDCETEKAQLESQLAAEKQKLEDMKQEQKDVNARLEAMGS